MNATVSYCVRCRLWAGCFVALCIAALLAACASSQSLLFQDDKAFSMPPALVMSHGRCYLRFEFADKPVRPVIASAKDGDDLVFRAHKFISAFPDTATIQYYAISDEYVGLTNRAFWQNPDGSRVQLAIESDVVLPNAAAPGIEVIQNLKD